jgi:acetylornithine deacetylase/succinyl-diaminopimelate desuccinylase-like protein
MARLGKFLRDLDRKRTPVHVTPAARAMIEAIAAALPRPNRDVMRALLRPRLTDRVLPLLGDRASSLEGLLRNTVNATVVHASDKVNVVPGVVEVGLDCRALPGFGPDDVIREVQALVGDDVELEVNTYDPGPPEPRLDQFEPLAQILRELEPDAVPVPMLQAGVTDARFLSRAGVQTYGYLPLRLPEDFEPFPLIHNADERVPVEALGFGVEAISRAIERYRP